MVTKTDWNSILSSSKCPNDLTEIINTLTILNKNFFLLKIKYISNKRFYKPWLSKTILNSIRNKHKMYKKTLFGEFDTASYKNYCRILNKVICASKKLTFHEIFHANDIKKTLIQVNILLHSK